MRTVDASTKEIKCIGCGGKNVVRHSISKSLTEYNYDKNGNLDLESGSPDNGIREEKDFCNDCAMYLDDIKEKQNRIIEVLDLEIELDKLSKTNNFNDATTEEILKTITNKNIMSNIRIRKVPNLNILILYGNIKNSNRKIYIEMEYCNSNLLVSYIETLKPIYKTTTDF